MGSVWRKIRRAAWTEEPGADAHHRRALLDGHLEVVAHAHRALPEAELVGQRGEAAEPVAGTLGGSVEADRHEPLDVQTDVPRAPDEVRCVGRCAAALLRLTRDVDLHEQPRV